MSQPIVDPSPLEPTPRPAAYTFGLGGVAEANRAYIGITLEVMADLIGVNPGSLYRIERNQRAMPPGFLDSVEDVVEQFDADVAAVDRGYADPSERGEVQLPADDPYGQAVVWRAAVEYRGIIPVRLGVVPATV